MKYTELEQLEEIMVRGRILRQRKARKVTRSLSASVAVLFFALAACIGAFGRTGVLDTETDYGSFLLSAETGGYVLVAVLAFVAGVITAVLINRYRTVKRSE